MRITITPDLLEYVGNNLAGEQDVRSDYSGRGMYGKPCVGVVADNPTNFVTELAMALVDQDYDGDDPGDWWEACNRLRDQLDKLGEPLSDGMGLSTIWYWPNITVE